MKKILCTFIALMSMVVAFAQTPNYQGIVYVTPTGAGTQSGDSWDNATASIADAQTIAQANNCVLKPVTCPLKFNCSTFMVGGCKW